MVFVNSTPDPATPYAQAQQMQSLVPGSRLVTWESADHTSFGRGHCLHRRPRDGLPRERRAPAGRSALQALTAADQNRDEPPHRVAGTFSRVKISPTTAAPRLAAPALTLGPGAQGHRRGVAGRRRHRHGRDRR